MQNNSLFGVLDRRPAEVAKYLSCDSGNDRLPEAPSFLGTQGSACFTQNQHFEVTLAWTRTHCWGLSTRPVKQALSNECLSSLEVHGEAGHLPA